MEEISQTLTELGLTKSQASIIFALQNLKKASVKTLEKATGIHRQQIYPSLLSLQETGLIEKILGTPSYYRTLRLNQVLNILFERNKKRLSDLEKKTQELTLEINACAKASEGKQDDYDFTLITGIERFSRSLTDWVREAKTIDYVLKFDRFSYQIAERLITSEYRHRKDVKVRIVTGAKPEDVKISGPPGAVVRFTRIDTPVDVAIYNHNRAHIALYSDRENVAQTTVSALTSNHPCYVSMIQSYFDALWNTAKKSHT
jgi:sugar-specific transcriptional regulator TrmB